MDESGEDIIQRVINLSAIIDQKLVSLEKHLQSAIFERDHSATPMESHSDKSRQLAEQQIDALNDEKTRLIALKNKISKHPLVIYHLSTSSGERNLALVPEGLGGIAVDGITLVSDISPLGDILKRSKAGDKITFNGQIMTVVSSTANS